MKETKLNLELLRKVRNRIAEIPESYDQSWFAVSNPDSPCGTAACLAGETIICAAPSISGGISHLNMLNEQWLDSDAEHLRAAPPVVEAASLLGITSEDACQMFESDGRDWPAPYSNQFEDALNAGSSFDQAQVAVAYLDECLKRGKVTW
jgi:hypothetical protein